MGIFYTNRDKIKIFLLIILLTVTIFYGLSRAYPLVSGVKVNIKEPYDGQIVSSTTFQIKGQVFRAKEIKIQGSPINIDTDGNFDETLTSSYPYTLIIVEASDKYNNKVTKVLRVIPR